jgi:hypothetical protein
LSRAVLCDRSKVVGLFWYPQKQIFGSVLLWRNAATLAFPEESVKQTFLLVTKCCYIGSVKIRAEI